MTEYSIAPIALDEIEEIIGYVATDDPQAAARVRDGLYQAFALLARRPKLGHRRPDLTALPLRFRTVLKRYMITYRGDVPPIEIVRVFGPGRDVATLLR